MNHQVKIKICGVQTIEVALAAIDAGADMLGVNFYPPSPRYIDPESAHNLIRQVRKQRSRPIRWVGVTVNLAIEELLRLIQYVGLDEIQLSGDETPELVKALHPYAYKAIRPSSISQAIEYAGKYARDAAAPALLIDAAHTGLYGGSGQRTDLGILKVLIRHMPIVVAGGLTAKNVKSVILAASENGSAPWGVDVASGVESAPGLKDPGKIRDFITAVRSTEAFLSTRTEVL